VNDSKVPGDVGNVYELVFNGLNNEAVKNAMAAGIRSAVSVPGIMKITAANYGGKLGPYKAVLKEVLDL
jgi:formylmethanofuran--tetrahydromethanopterin N-formyltransferase